MISSHQLDATFAALADPTRRAILARLASGEASVGELAEPFDMSQPAISKHLKVLERAGLITSGREAQRRPRRMDPAPLAEAAEWIERYRKIWEGNYKRLDALLDELQRAGAREPANGAPGDRSVARGKGERPAVRASARRSTSKATTKRRGGKGK
ncbi:MAG TPA: metalloregulator ArsR/SmtB family transcription factor [Gemmatimonadaceae bacterium]|jgi:Predicted transcriptional regulators